MFAAIVCANYNFPEFALAPFARFAPLAMLLARPPDLERIPRALVILGFKASETFDTKPTFSC